MYEFRKSLNFNEISASLKTTANEIAVQNKALGSSIEHIKVDVIFIIINIKVDVILF